MRLFALAVSILIAAPAIAQQYIFAWPPEETKLKPRGGTTKGAPVTLEKEPSEAWRKLREAGLSAQERDRRAILAMAGPYRVTFDFLEVVRFDPSLKPDAPYQSWATEYVFVAEDRPDFIALQHILLMRLAGKESEPLVQRHWRQEWRFEPDRLLVYEGANTWLSKRAERRSAWTQTVLQVDDSPRYAAHGRWEHTQTHSTWLSDETWRPLPRREFSVRKDYQVLVGTNRHTITPLGWVQEENNLKVVVADRRSLAREYGVARYDRIRDFDFEPARRYYTATEPFWAEVRAAWRELETRAGRFTLRAQPDQGSLFIPFFEYAGKLEDGRRFDRDEARAFIRKTLDERYLAR